MEITRTELSATELRSAATRSREADAARRMLALALVLEGKSRKEAAEAYGMERQTLRGGRNDHRHRQEELCRAPLHDLAALRMLRRLNNWARSIKRDVHALWLAARHPRTPWYARGLAIGIAAYALSPIDLIPDFIPLLGLLDEAILLPLLILLAIRLVPVDVLAECRAHAAAAEGRPVSRAGIAIVAGIWLLLALLALWLLWPRTAV